jgi:uncharacterized protein
MKLFPADWFKLNGDMSLALFRFYEELNEFLPERKRKQQFPYSFFGDPSVKDAIEALGVPHVEVDMILVNGISVDFYYKLKDDDSVSVYPVFESMDISSVTHLREKPLRDLKFILDVHLGKLAKYLRLSGFDTLYNIEFNDDKIIALSKSDKRLILTRDKGLLKNKLVTHGYWIRSQHPEYQMKEVIIRFDLKSLIRPFTRCLVCNGILSPVSKEDIADKLLAKTKQYYSDYKKCFVCNRIYWEGSHFSRMKNFIENIAVNTK